MVLELDAGHLVPAGLAAVAGGWTLGKVFVIWVNGRVAAAVGEVERALATLTDRLDRLESDVRSTVTEASHDIKAARSLADTISGRLDEISRRLDR